MGGVRKKHIDSNRNTEKAKPCDNKISIFIVHNNLPPKCLATNETSDKTIFKQIAYTYIHFCLFFVWCLVFSSITRLSRDKTPHRINENNTCLVQLATLVN